MNEAMIYISVKIKYETNNTWQFTGEDKRYESP